MTKRGIGAAAQDQIVKSITSFALYGFPESHAASFALIAYASALSEGAPPGGVLRVAPERVADGLLPPGDAGEGRAAPRHAVLPIDVARSGWKCRWENGRRAPGLALRPGLREDDGRADRRRAGRASLRVDRRSRAAVRAASARLDLLAHAGALASFGKTRRAALWQVAKVARPAGPLFADVPTDDPSPLRR